MRHLRGVALYATVVMLLCCLPGGAQAQQSAFVREGTAVYPGVDVNLSGGGRLHLAFEAQCVDAQAAEMAAGPEAREAIVLYLRDKTAAVLATPKGKRRLKDELVTVMNKAVGGPRIVRVYYLQFVLY